jgi:hypothetical protein
MRKYLVIDNRTKKSVTVDLEEAARITGLEPADIERALENEGLCETERHTITETIAPESPHNCFMLDYERDPTSGYYRKRENALEAAKRYGIENPRIVELNPPEHIACEDDEPLQ